MGYGERERTGLPSQGWGDFVALPSRTLTGRLVSGEYEANAKRAQGSVDPAAPLRTALRPFSLLKGPPAFSPCSSSVF